MPTYHLAVVVDDYSMKISHAFRGEEWLPSAPVHVLLWRYLFGIDEMPQWAHLPLILKPDGNGKLSKRDGDRLGFPVYAMDWMDPVSGETTKGFKELGFLPEAFINLLAVLGWNDGTEQEIFTLDELIDKFSIERVHKGGAKFDFEKAKWFNHEWIKKLDVEHYLPQVKNIFQSNGILVDDEKYLQQVMSLIKERCTLLPDFHTHGWFFFRDPLSYEQAAIAAKWDAGKRSYFNEMLEACEKLPDWNAESIEGLFKSVAAEKNIKAGEIQMILRIMLVGSKTGPGVFLIAETIGKAATLNRINKTLNSFQG